MKFCFLQLRRKSIARSRSTPRPCRTATMAPRSTCREEGCSGSAAAVATCPKRPCRFCGVGCMSIVSTPTHRSRRNSACRAKPIFLCSRWGRLFLPAVLCHGDFDSFPQSSPFQFCYVSCSHFLFPGPCGAVGGGCSRASCYVVTLLECLCGSAYLSSDFHYSQLSECSHPSVSLLYSCGDH